LERQHVITAADLVLDSLDIMLDFRNMMFWAQKLKTWLGSSTCKGSNSGLALMAWILNPWWA
jgi:hypothetical protein